MAPYDYDEEPQGSGFSFDLLNILRILYIRKWMILLFGLGGLAVTMMLGSMIKINDYMTRFRLLLRDPLQQMSVVDNADQYNVARPETLIDMIRLNATMEEVADSLGGRVQAREIKDNINVHSSRQNEIVTVSLIMNDPDLAVETANLLARAVVRKTVEFQRRVARNALIFSEQRLTETKAKLDSVDVEIGQFKRRNNLVDFDAELTNVTSEKNRLEQELRVAQSELNAINIQLQSTQSELGLQPDQTPGSTRRFSPTRSRIAELRTQLEEAKLRYTDQNPTVIRLENQITELERRLEEGDDEMQIEENYEINPTRTALEIQLLNLEAQRTALVDRIATINREREALSERITTIPEIEQEYTELLRVRSGLEQLYTDLLSFIEQANLIAETDQGYFEILEAATGARPLPSKKHLVMISGLFLGMAFGTVLFIGLELLDDSIKSSKDITRLLKLEPLGEIPIFKNQSVLIDSSNLGAPITEVFRLILSNVHTAALPRKLRILGVTSTTEGEGRTNVAVNLAIAATLQGQRVALLDSNIRGLGMEGPIKSLASEDMKQEAGLINYLTGNLEVENILRETPLKNLIWIPAGPYHTSYVELLGSKRMDQLLNELIQMCDLVVVNMPALIPRVDATYLAKKVESAVLVIDFKEVSARIINEGIERLQSNGCRVVGGILNQVEDLYRDRFYDFDSDLSHRNIAKIIETRVSSWFRELRSIIRR